MYRPGGKKRQYIGKLWEVQYQWGIVWLLGAGIEVRGKSWKYRPQRILCVGTIGIYFAYTEKMLMFFKKRTDMIKFQFLKILLIAVEKNKEKDCSRIQLFE